jgi:hypothetical protein
MCKITNKSTLFCELNVDIMAAKNVVADLIRGDKLTGNNYDIWHRKI